MKTLACGNTPTAKSNLKLHFSCFGLCRHSVLAFELRVHDAQH